MINETQEEVRDKVKGLTPTQKDIAIECDIDPNYFNKWLNGKVDLGSNKLDRVIRWTQKK